MSQNTSPRVPGALLLALLIGGIGLLAFSTLQQTDVIGVSGYEWMLTAAIVVVAALTVATLFWGRIARFWKWQPTKLLVKDARGNILAKISTSKTLNRGLDDVWIDKDDDSVHIIVHDPSKHIIITGRCAGRLEVTGTSTINVRTRGGIVQNV